MHGRELCSVESAQFALVSEEVGAGIMGSSRFMGGYSTIHHRLPHMTPNQTANAASDLVGSCLTVAK
jgi:hypothetical protein